MALYQQLQDWKKEVYALQLIGLYRTMRKEIANLEATIKDPNQSWKGKKIIPALQWLRLTIAQILVTETNIR